MTTKDVKKFFSLLYLRHNHFSCGIFFCLIPFQYHNALQKAQMQYHLLAILAKENIKMIVLVTSYVNVVNEFKNVSFMQYILFL